MHSERVLTGTSAEDVPQHLEGRNWLEHPYHPARAAGQSGTSEVAAIAEEGHAHRLVPEAIRGCSLLPYGSTIPTNANYDPVSP